MKKGLSLLLCLLMSFFITALVFGNGGAQKASNAGKKLVLYTELTEGSLEGDQLRKSIQNFCANNPGISIEAMSSASQDFDTFFKTAVAGGEQIDLAEINIQFFRDYVTRGLLKPLDGLVDFSKVPRIQMAWDQEKYFSRKDQRYGVPMRLDSSAVYYNPAIFSQYGIAIPKTWDDIYAIKDKLAGTGVAAMVYAGAEPWWNPMHFNIIFYQMTKNHGLEVNDKFMKGDFSPEVIKPYIDTLQFFADLDANGVFIPGTQGMDFPSALTVFTSGKAAMFYMGTWFQDNLASSAPDFKYSIFPVPVMDKSLKSEPAGSIAVMYSIYNNTKYPDVAAKFIEYHCSPARVGEIFSEGGSGINITPGAKLDLSNPVKSIFNDIGPSTCIWLDAIWEPEIITAFQQGCQAAILKQKTPTQVMDDIIALYKQLRQQGKTFY